jgi:hypothetical protein
MSRPRRASRPFRLAKCNTRKFLTVEVGALRGRERRAQATVAGVVAVRHQQRGGHYRAASDVADRERNRQTRGQRRGT